MVTLLHGDNIEASRAALVQLKGLAAGKEIREVSGMGLDATALVQALQSQSLFGGDVLVILENTFAPLGKKEKQAAALVSLLTTQENNVDIIIWEPKELGKTLVGKFGPKVKILLYKTPVVIFTFLDGVKPGNQKQLLDLYDQASAVDAPELLFALLVRRVHQLLAIAAGVPLPSLQGWQLSRLTNQARLFTIERLCHMQEDLLVIDSSIKSGTSPYGLSSRIQQWLIAL